MGDLQDDLKAFFGKVVDDEEGAKVIAFLDHDFQFRVTGQAPFFMKCDGKSISFEAGELSDDDYMRNTDVVTDERTLREIMDGWIKPSDAYFNNLIYMSGVMANEAFNYGLLRLFRRGSELKR